MRALVIGASGGIGAALLAALRARVGVTALGLARPEIDITDEASVAAAAARIGGPLDLVILATGALHIDGRGPEKRLAELDAGALARAFAINTIGPALVLKHFAPSLPRGTPSVFAVLSARVGSIGDNQLGGWYGYRASKAALNQLLRTASIEVARSHKQARLLAIHPGTVVTRLSVAVTGGARGGAPEVAAGLILGVLDDPPPSGSFVDYAGRAVAW